MARRLIASLTVVLATMLLAAGPGLAALAGEVSAGQSVAQRLQSGRADCQSLRSTDFEHLGEYVMDRMVGSRAGHQAMNARMDAMMGEANADRMHELLGRRYAGCGGTASSGVTPGGLGPGMMGGGGGGMMGGGALMNSASWSWMHDGSWQHMTRAQWHQLAGRMMGGDIAFGSDGRSTGAVIALILGSALVAAALVIVVVRYWPRRRPAEPHPS